MPTTFNTRRYFKPNGQIMSYEEMQDLEDAAWWAERERECSWSCCPDCDAPRSGGQCKACKRKDRPWFIPA